MEVSPPKVLQEALVVPEKTLMGPGPSNYPQRVRKALALPVLGHFHPETFKIMDDTKEGIKYLFQTINPLTLCLSASGHAGMEAGLCNLVEDGDVVLIANQGLWGERAAEMSRRLGGDVRVVKKPPGEVLSLQEARREFQLYSPKVFFIAHGESSTGLLQNLEGFGDLCREFNCILMVDAVITLGCVPFYADKWKIDVVYSGSQKVLNAPPGITPISFGERAINKIKSRKSPIKSYNFDIMSLAEYWNCFPNSKRIYHHTISSTLLYGLREALALFIEQGGLAASWKRHETVSRRLYAALESHGFKLFIDDVKNRAPSVTSVIVPPGVDVVKVSSYAMQHYKFEIAGGLGPTAGKVFRIGLLGNNAKGTLVDKTVEILVEAIKNDKLSAKM